jgi:hypothetical protein
MYQSLIFSFVGAGVLRHEPGSLSAPLYTQYREGLADTLVDGMRRNIEFRGDLFRVEMLIDKAEAIELPRTQPRNALGYISRCVADRPRARPARFVRIVQGKTHPA